MTTEQRHLTVRLPVNLYERLDLIAKSEDRTVSAEIRRLIKQRIEAHERKATA